MRISDHISYDPEQNCYACVCGEDYDIGSLPSDPKHEFHLWPFTFVHEDCGKRGGLSLCGEGNLSLGGGGDLSVCGVEGIP